MIEPKPVSPTALESLDGCERQFGFKYWSGIQVPRTSQLELGTAVHDQIELYLKTGELDYVKNSKAAAIAARGLHLLPKPMMPGLSIEGEFKFELEGVEFFGRMDWLYPWQVQDRKIIVVGDNKTSSDPSKWAKTVDDLEDDYQAVIYGYYGLQKAPDADAVMHKWVYFPTKNKGQPTPVEHHISAHSLTEKMKAILPAARRVVSLRVERPDPNTLAPNTSHCNAYGGCPYRYHCKLSDSDTIRGFFKMTQTTIPSALSQIAARLGAPATAAPAAPSPVNPPEAAHPVPTPVEVKAIAQEAKDEAKEAAEAFKAAAEPPKAKKEPKPKAEKKLTAPAPAGFVSGQTKCISMLFIDCIPSSPYSSAAEFIAAAKADIRDVTKTEQMPDGAADFRFIEYGKGAGYLTALVEEKVKAQGLVDKLVVDSDTPEGKAVLSVLQGLAHEIVRGV